MTTDLERRLRQALHDDAQRARLANPDRPPAPNAGVSQFEPDERVAAMQELSESSSSTFRPLMHRPRVLVAAAVIVVVIAAAGIAIRDERRSHVVTNRPAPTTPAPAPRVRAGEQIRVTPNSIRLGGALRNALVARADGHTYVMAGTDHTDGFYIEDRALVAAFDDAGSELWRTQVDGYPRDIAVFAGDVWISHQGSIVRIDANDGRVVGSLKIPDEVGLIEAFGSLWVQAGDVVTPDAGSPARLIRVGPDLWTTTVDLPAGVGSSPSAGPNPAVPGAGAIWVPLKQGGVAVIDPDTLDVTVIRADDIGHEVMTVAFDGDVAYVSGGEFVTSIVDRKVRATFHAGAMIQYLGPIDGAFGVLIPVDRFEILQANDPMVVAHRRISTEGHPGGVRAIDGDAWLYTGHDLHRIGFLPAAGDG